VAWRFHVGWHATYRATQVFSNRDDGEAGVVDVIGQSILLIDVECDDVDESCADLLVRLRRVCLQSSGSVFDPETCQGVDYDSAVPGSDPGNYSNIANAIDTPWRVRIQRDGEIVSWTPPRLGNFTMHSLLGMGMVLANDGPCLPALPVRKGDVWRGRIPRPVWPLNSGQQVRCEVADADETSVRVVFDVLLNGSETERATEERLTKYGGEWVFRPDRGMLAEAKVVIVSERRSSNEGQDGRLVGTCRRETHLELVSPR
jgi:hypothetical protein